ncbi:PHB depolymerase family esterase [Sorangium sp. So ce327]|jgi:polyhydroxybutyrate depolymerase|uniref:alpha/beta hydrolase family esterase n=1 Tax=unclassified Sorangium TaxID=2621164 RepID=UPI003F5ED489
MTYGRTSLPKLILVLGALGISLWGCGGDSDGTTSAGGDGGGPAAGASTSSSSGSGSVSAGTTGSTSSSTGSDGASTSGAGGDGGGGGPAAGASTSSAGGGASTSSAGGGASTSGAGGGEPITCPSTALRAGDTNKTITVGGSNRSYVLHVPAAYDGSKPVPLVVDLHPLGGSGPSERSGSPYPAQTDPEGVIMAFPSGLAGPSGGAWNVGPCCVKNTDDVAFVKAMVAQIQETACIDPKRIYAVGFSMGGGMSHYLACHAADTFAAVAPAAFDLLQENIADCKPSRPITVISFRSTGDPIVPYAGGYSAVVSGMPITFLGAKSTLEKWGQINKCTGSPSAEDSKGCSTFSNCEGGVEVALCTKQGGGHDYGNAAVGWPVLKRHTMP